jgi:hypothetical protein
LFNDKPIYFIADERRTRRNKEEETKESSAVIHLMTMMKGTRGRADYGIDGVFDMDASVMFLGFS